jgi:transposase
MRFKELYEQWQESHLSQHEVAQILGISERTLRRHIERYETEGLEGLIDKRLSQVSHKRAPVDEVMKLVDLYQSQYQGWNTKHFHSWYQRHHGGTRSYTWTKNCLQEAKVIVRAKARGKHRKKRERSPLRGMMVHQEASTHAWVPDIYWDLVVTMDDATGEHLSMFFCEEEGTASSMHGIGQAIARFGLFSSLYTDRGSHYFITPEANGKVDKVNLTQVGRALAQLGITHIAAYSPEARGRSERAFQTHQERLPKELTKMGITDMQAACGLAQLERAPEFIQARKDNFAFLSDRLQSCAEFLHLPQASEHSDPSWFGFPITLKENAPVTRLDLLTYLDQNKVGTRLLFAGNLTCQPSMAEAQYRVSGDLRNTDVVMNQTFWIGVQPALTREMLGFAAGKIEEYLGVNF